MAQTAATIDEPLRSYHFIVEIDGIQQASFAEAIVPAGWADVIEYREGNQLGSIKIPGRVHYGNIVLRWGITASRELYDWWHTVEQGTTLRRSVAIIMLRNDLTPAGRWIARNAWPVKFGPLTLNAESSDVAIETLELAFDSIQLTS